MSEVRIVLGKRGSGKSWKLREMLRQEPRFVLYDTLKEPTYDEFRRTDNFPELCRYLATNPPVFQIAYSWDGTRDREEDFELVCRAAYHCRGMVFACDEVDLFCSPTYLPRHLDMVISLGRHRGISFYCATRRPKEVPPLIRSQAHEVISFRQTEPADLEWCSQVMGDESRILPSLADYEPHVWRDGEALGSCVTKTPQLQEPEEPEEEAPEISEETS